MQYMVRSISSTNSEIRKHEGQWKKGAGGGGGGGVYPFLKETTRHVTTTDSHPHR